MKCEEIFAALELLEKERGIPQDFMMGKIIQALTAAYKKDHEGMGENLVIEANEETATVRLFLKKEVVEVVDDPATEISLDEARNALPQAQLGDVVLRSFRQLINKFFSLRKLNGAA